MTRLLLLPLLAVLAFVGCSDDPTPDSDASSPDAGQDTAVADMTMPDASPDTSSDAGADLAIDTGADAGPDMRSDVGEDVGIDLGVDMATTDDHECEPDGLALGTWDPDCVYLLGTLIEGSSGWDVFTHPGTASDVYFGFGDYPSDPVIRPSDGKLIVADFDEVYEFEPDVVWPIGEQRPDRPADALANDTPIDAPRCDTVGAGTWRAMSFPDGTLAYGCYNDGGTLYLEGTTDSLEANGEEAVALGAGRRILVDPMDADAVIIQNGTSTTVTGLRDYERFIAARWIDGRFVAAVAHAYTPWDIEMWAIAGDGSASSLGAVQLAPDEVESYFQDCVLDGKGALYCFTTAPGTLSDSITVFTTDAAPDTIYSENGERVAIHISYLATGP